LRVDGGVYPIAPIHYPSVGETRGAWQRHAELRHDAAA
jgi:hypothetical protein